MKKQSGFTLIELLIVIVIIGILAGILVAIIDPAGQQNRARDAGIEAAIIKIALATEGFVSAYGKVPNEVQFLAGLEKVVESNNTCQDVNDFDCVFSVTGNTLPMTCRNPPNNWYGTDRTSRQCDFHYEGNVDGDTMHFRIWARSHGLFMTLFHYDNLEGAMQHCESNSPLNCWEPY